MTQKKEKPMAKPERTTIESKDSKGDKKVVVVRPPTAKDKNQAQLQYLKAFRQALENGAILKQKLDDHLKEQGIWDEAKQKQYEEIVTDINDGERKLQKGGIKLQEAKEIAFKMKTARLQFRSLVAERTVMDNNTAESQADNSSFDYLASVCIIDTKKGEPIFSNMDEYRENGDEPYVAEAAAELASKLYQLDPNYDKGLPENAFLVKYKFADEELRLINKEGKLVDEDGKLVNEDGRYINEEGQLIDRDGVPVDEEGNYKQDFSPFLDDNDNPIIMKEETEKEEAKETEGVATGKKKKKAVQAVETEVSDS